MCASRCLWKVSGEPGEGREDIIPIGGYPCVPPQGAKSEKRQPEGGPHSPLEAAQTSRCPSLRSAQGERSGCPAPALVEPTAAESQRVLGPLEPTRSKRGAVKRLRN